MAAMQRHFQCCTAEVLEVPPWNPTLTLEVLDQTSILLTSAHQPSESVMYSSVILSRSWVWPPLHDVAPWRASRACAATAAPRRARELEPV